MKTSTFLENTEPVRMLDPQRQIQVTVVYIDEDAKLAKWVISDQEERLHKYDAFAKDALVFERIIQPLATYIQVLDLTDDTLYTISVADFDEHKWLFRRKAGEQWAVDRWHWRQESV